LTIDNLSFISFQSEERESWLFSHLFARSLPNTRGI